MQKVLRRTAMAEKMGQRKKDRMKELARKADAAEHKARNGRIKGEVMSAVRREKQRRKEDYELGPLSPWRANMANMLAGGFGTFSNAVATAETDLALKADLQRVGGNMLRPGDRVVVVRGHESLRGHISTVERYDEERATFQLENLNVISVIPSGGLEHYQPAGHENDIIPMTRQFQYTDLALVYPLPNPHNGDKPEDCIIMLEDLQAKNRYWDEYERKVQYERYVMPQGIRIPWPAEKKPEQRDFDGDTLRLATEEDTFYPRLLNPPMPASVIDEMRNRYSRYRTRHTDEYIAAKTAEDEADALEKERAAAVVPRGARNIARMGRRRSAEEEKSARELDEPREPLTLDGKLAEAIGAHMAAAQDRQPPSRGPSSSL